MQELVKQHFTTEKVKDIFTKGRPKWLVDLIKTRYISALIAASMDPVKVACPSRCYIDTVLPDCSR